MSEDNSPEHPTRHDGKRVKKTMGQVTFLSTPTMVEDPRKVIKDKEKRNRELQLLRSLKKWSDIIMLPDPEIKSGEIIRPFVIMQP